MPKNPIKYSQFDGVKYCYFSSAYEPNGATFSKVTYSNQIFISLTSRIKKRNIRNCNILYCNYYI